MSPATTPEVRWTGDDRLEIGDTRFVLSVDPDVYTAHPTASDELLMVKRKDMVEWLIARLPTHDISTVLEVGIYKGGSSAFLNSLLQPDVQIAIDLDPAPVEALDKFAKTAATGALHCHYGIDQANEIALARILADELGDRPLDLVIDDGSHLYRESRSTFEVAFPRLRPGGRYLIEEWNWAHRNEDLWQYQGGYWADRPALTNLVAELLMIAGTDSRVISQIVVERDIVEIVRGDRPLPTPFRLAATYLNRGLRFRPIL